jgi:Protein of unknown function (DUF3105)
MAQRKSPPQPTRKPTRPASGASAAGRPPTNRPPVKKPGKSIVNQRQTPWGLIITAVVLVIFAAAIVGVVVARSGGSDGHSSKGGQTVDASDPYRQPELPAAKAIKGLTYKVEALHTHVSGSIKYDASPPIGGDHNGYWADCSGTVYSQPIANENAVHMLEHGAIWITYNAKTLPTSSLATLKKLVQGQDRMALSPYPDLKSPISLQAWGYQLFVQKATDPRIKQFISVLRYNKKTTPEYGATCDQPTFKAHPSTFGHPVDGPGM